MDSQEVLQNLQQEGNSNGQEPRDIREPNFRRRRRSRRPKPTEPREERDLDARREEASELRDEIRDLAAEEFITSQPRTNGDEERFEKLNRPGFASFTKTLSHDSRGFVEEMSFDSLLDAVAEGTQEAFEGVQLGGGVRLLANPLNAFSFQAIGNDSNGARMAAAPRFSSRNTAVDIVERYWMALSRDIPFADYENSDLIKDACEDLNKLGFKQEFGFECTPQKIFRAPYEGAFVGPHVSQFLLQNFLFGNQPIQQLQRPPKDGLDFLTDLETWNKVNNGDIDPTGEDVFDDTRRIITLRDAGQWVHIDLPFQSSVWAVLILSPDNLNVAQSNANPYFSGAISTSAPFGSLGTPDIASLSALAAVYALKHAWFQKWCVHRRLRPEVYGQRLELFRRGELGNSSGKDIFQSDLFLQLFSETAAEVLSKTEVLGRIFDHNKQQNIDNDRADRDGTWLLPIAFPEGSPTHPAYPGGHSAFIAAGATIAKAFFADVEFPNPVVPTPDGMELKPYNGEKLTVHGELNKLISNVTLFRDGAGMHWRTDGTASGSNAGVDRPGVGIRTGGNLLGEAMAVSMLRDIKRTYREEVGTFEFRGIGGNLIRI